MVECDDQVETRRDSGVIKMYVTVLKSFSHTLKNVRITLTCSVVVVSSDIMCFFLHFWCPFRIPVLFVLTLCFSSLSVSSCVSDHFVFLFNIRSLIIRTIIIIQVLTINVIHDKPYKLYNLSS